MYLLIFWEIMCLLMLAMSDSVILGLSYTDYILAVYYLSVFRDLVMPLLRVINSYKLSLNFY